MNDIRPTHLTGLAYTGIITGVSALPVLYAMSHYLDADMVRTFLKEDVVAFWVMLLAIVVLKIVVCAGLLFAQRWAWILAVAACATSLALSIVGAIMTPSIIPASLWHSWHRHFCYIFCFVAIRERMSGSKQRAGRGPGGFTLLKVPKEGGGLYLVRLLCR